MKIKNHIPNLISIARIVLSFFLLIFKPFSLIFFAFYLVCGFSDILDGFLARKLNVSSKIGSKIDSFADLIFYIILMIIIINNINLPIWVLVWIGLIGLTKTISFVVGFIKYKTMYSLHTILNKFTGFILFTIPIFYKLCGTTISAYIICSVASISALEELIINLTSKELYIDVKHILKIIRMDK